MNVRYPFGVDGRGHTAAADDDAHVVEMIEQLLLTSPNERVNRGPTFGSGVLQLVFAPNRTELAAALRASVEAALQQWLGDLIEVTDLRVESEDATVRLRVGYTLRRTGETREVTVAR